VGRLRIGYQKMSKVAETESFGERFGQRILDLRTDRGETQQQVAEGAFDDPMLKSRLSLLENGEVKRPQSKTVNALCAYFNISPAELAEIRRPKPAPVSDTRTEALEHYANQLKRDLEETRVKLAQAEASAALAERAEILEDRLADPEAALQEAKKTVADLKALLDRDSNELGGPLLTRARDALDHLDYREAERILAEIEADGDLVIARTARAAYARGLVAELDIRWADAAKHYGRAADLNPTADTLFKANSFNWRAGEYDTALGYATRLVKLRRSEGETGQKGLATALNEQAIQYFQLGMYPRAEGLHREALEIDKATLGEGHPEYATRLNNLAGVLRAQGRYEEAEGLYREALEIDKATIGEGHQDYAAQLSNLSVVLREQGRFVEAEEVAREALKICKATIGEGHPEYAIRLTVLGYALTAQGRYEEAERLLREALEITKAALGEGHPAYATRLNNLADLYRAMERFEDADPLFQEALEKNKLALGETHPNVAIGINNLARLYEDMGRVAEALPLIEEALAILKTSLGPDHPTTAKLQENRDRIAGKLAEG
jgi:tetratricopeptide (TPR) repeat protein